MEQQHWKPQVGDRVCHCERGLGIIEKIALDSGVPYLIKLDTGNYWWATQINLHLISRAVHGTVDHTTPAKDVVIEGDPSKRTEGVCYPPTEWQPKWGEEVEVWDDDEDCISEAYYVGKNPNPKTKDTFPYAAIRKLNDVGGGGAYKHIRPIPPKPNTLREEVEELLLTDRPNAMFTEGFKSGIRNVLAIIDRHEKGGLNG